MLLSAWWTALRETISQPSVPSFEAKVTQTSLLMKPQARPLRRLFCCVQEPLLLLLLLLLLLFRRRGGSHIACL